MKNVDYSYYLSIDNGKGLLLNKWDVFILEQHDIDYLNCSNIGELIFILSNYIDDNAEGDIEDLELVLEHLVELHYYTETKK